MPEVNDADFELLKLHKKLIGGKHRLSILKMVKESDPNIPIPEIDIQDRIDAATADLRKENETLRQRVDTTEQIASLEKRREPLKKRGYTSERIKEVEKFMIERKIGDHVTAADFMELNARSSAPTPAVFVNTAELPKDENLLKDPTNFARVEAARVVQELQTANRNGLA